MIRLFLLSALLAVITCRFIGSASAQTGGTGAISGIVTDPSGAVVSGARLTVTNEATSAVQTAVTTGTGNFVVPLLPPGQYRMVRIDGLATLSGNGQGVRFAQNTYIFNDDLAWTKGRHSFRFGGGIDRGQNNETAFHYIGALW